MELMRLIFYGSGSCLTLLSTKVQALVAFYHESQHVALPNAFVLYFLKMAVRSLYGHK